MAARLKRSDHRVHFCGDLGGCVDHQQDQVGVLGAVPGCRDHGPVEPPPGLEDARRVDQQDLRLALDGDAHQPCAGRLRLGADDRDLLSDQRVDQRRLARVRRADDGDETGAGGSFRHCNCFNSAAAAAVSASCLLVPSAVASPSLATETRTVNFGAWCAPVRDDDLVDRCFQALCGGQFLKSGFGMLGSAALAREIRLPERADEAFRRFDPAVEE